MSLSIILHDQPEFYTNLDTITGSIVLTLNKPETIGSIAVKLEGDSRTCVTAAPADGFPASPLRSASSTTFSPLSPVLSPFSSLHGPNYPGANSIVEDHKVLYQVLQVFPDSSAQGGSSHSIVGGDRWLLAPGRHEYPFRFKVPLNNACGNRREMARTGGLVGAGGLAAAGQALLGRGAMRLMDGSRQLLYQHVTQTLPPSLTGSWQAEIRYYIKATVQRPGLMRENWRYNVGFKFMPIEPPRPNPSATRQETYCRRPFVFSPAAPAPSSGPPRSFPSKLSSFFSSASSSRAGPSSSSSPSPPSILISARLPHPPVLTCNRPLPLRLVAEKLVQSSASVRLVSLQVDLVGTTQMSSLGAFSGHSERFVVFSDGCLSLPLTSEPDAPVGSELEIPSSTWASIPLPNLITPSFHTCNISRTYALELNLSVAWDLPGQPQFISLPLIFHSVAVYSGIPPPLTLAINTAVTSDNSSTLAPPLPPRPSVSAPASPTDPNPRPLYEDAPPSYDEAMAQTVGSPFDGTGLPRPAFSGITNENAPSQIPEKK